MEFNSTLPSHLQILAVTGNAREYFLKECIKAGMDDAITKPYQFSMVLSKLDNLKIS